MTRRYEVLTRYFSVPNVWDVVASLLLLSLFFGFAWLASQMATPYHLGERIPISLQPDYLPYYAMRTVFRMSIALLCSLLFTFIFGTLAAKNRQAERIIIPMLDILQSVPILGFLSITVVGFITLFPGSLLGPECASIFVIFTSQAWNMTFSFYQSLLTVPADIQEAACLFRLSRWQRFWRVEVPFATPALLWNTMMSMSGGWFFVVASEAISVANQDISLPGIGSYIALAIDQADFNAVGYAIVAMLVVIVLYDQLFFRPLLCWSDKFKIGEEGYQERRQSWLINLFQRTHWLRRLGLGAKVITNAFINLGGGCAKPRYHEPQPPSKTQRLIICAWYVVLLTLVSVAAWHLVNFIGHALSWLQVMRVLLLGLVTGIKVVILIVMASFILVPIGVWIGIRPQWARAMSPLIQIAAAFPANLLFPAVVLGIIYFDLNPEVWTAPLMILGAQWYILFNVIAGASALPKELYLATANLGVRGWLWWKRFILPGVYPYYITGAITAAGGAWNASVVSEVVTWGDTTLTATGLGAYISQTTTIGDFPRIALGIAVMCFYVFVFNRLLWRPLYDWAQRRFVY